MLTVNDDRIIDIIEIPVSQIGKGDNPSASSNREYLKAVYQVFHKDNKDKIGDQLIHEDIGYSGSSKDVWYRTVSIRQPNGSHGCGVYMRNNDLNLDDYLIRYLCLDEDLSPKQIKEFETEIQNTTKEKFGAKFAWAGASGGNSGSKDRILSLIPNLNTEEMLEIKEKLESAFMEKAMDAAQQAWSAA
jgi:hypothetical protein